MTSKKFDESKTKFGVRPEKEKIKTPVELDLDAAVAAEARPSRKPKSGLFFKRGGRIVRI